MVGYGVKAVYSGHYVMSNAIYQNECVVNQLVTLLSLSDDQMPGTISIPLSILTL